MNNEVSLPPTGYVVSNKERQSISNIQANLEYPYSYQSYKYQEGLSSLICRAYSESSAIFFHCR